VRKHGVIAFRVQALRYALIVQVQLDHLLTEGPGKLNIEPAGAA
jgi:hypothetical protein